MVQGREAYFLMSRSTSVSGTVLSCFLRLWLPARTKNLLGRHVAGAIGEVREADHRHERRALTVIAGFVVANLKREIGNVRPERRTLCAASVLPHHVDDIETAALGSLAQVRVVDHAHDLLHGRRIVGVTENAPLAIVLSVGIPFGNLIRCARLGSALRHLGVSISRGACHAQ